ncbi:RNA polymerase sigma factor, partial [Streptomyces humi]
MTEQETRRRRARSERLAHVVTEPLHRYLLRRTAPDLVEDVLSETMLVLWRRIDHVPGLGGGSPPDRDEVLPWCYGVARRRSPKPSGARARGRRTAGDALTPA